MGASISSVVKPLALVDNKTGHIMLLVDARTLGGQLEGGAACRLHEDDARLVLVIEAPGAPIVIGPFSKAEADKLRYAARLTVGAFQDGVVTRAREVRLPEPVA